MRVACWVLPQVVQINTEAFDRELYVVHGSEALNHSTCFPEDTHRDCGDLAAQLHAK